MRFFGFSLGDFFSTIHPEKKLNKALLPGIEKGGAGAILRFPQKTERPFSGTPTNPTNRAESPHRSVDRRCEIPGFGTENFSATKLEELVFVEGVFWLLENGENLRHEKKWQDKKMPSDVFFWGEINVFFFGYFRI